MMKITRNDEWEEMGTVARGGLGRFYAAMGLPMADYPLSRIITFHLGACAVQLVPGAAVRVYYRPVIVYPGKAAEELEREERERVHNAISSAARTHEQAAISHSGTEETGRSYGAVA